jgi:hypothetical protein
MWDANSGELGKRALFGAKKTSRVMMMVKHARCGES